MLTFSYYYISIPHPDTCAAAGADTCAVLETVAPTQFEEEDGKVQSGDDSTSKVNEDSDSNFLVVVGACMHDAYNVMW